MITTMRGCVAHNDLWPWTISSRSFGLDLENRVRSVASTVLDGVFLYLAQMITIIRGCVACYVWIFGKFFKCFALVLEKKSTVLDGFFPYLAQMITDMRGYVAYNDLWHWSIFSRSFGLDLENRAHSIASTVLDGFFPYLVFRPWLWKSCTLCNVLSSRSIISMCAQIDITIRGCVEC